MSGSEPDCSVRLHEPVYERAPFKAEGQEVIVEVPTLCIHPPGIRRSEPLSQL